MAYIPLPGSERLPAPNATVWAERVPEDTTITVSVVPSDSSQALKELAPLAVAHNLRMWFEHGIFKLEGAASDLQKAFQVELTLAQTAEGQAFRQRVGPIQVPEELAPHIIAVLGLDNRPVAKGHFWMQEARPEAYSPGQVAQLYNFPQGDGAGRTVAVIELGGGFSGADCQAAGIDPSLVQAVSVDGGRNDYKGDPNTADGEVALDIQVIGGIAPKCKQLVYFAPNTDAAFVDAVAAAANANPDAISISWGAPETGWTGQAMQAMDVVFAKAVAKGIPVFVAAGDGGSNDGTSAPVADFPAAAPHATGCGGTVLPSIAQEAVWNDMAAGGGSTGGGISRTFGVPAYQKGLGLSGRGVPDVAGVAAPSTGFNITINGHQYSFGGTSDVAPTYVGLTALLVANLGQPIGDFNSKVYPLLGTSAFHDITRGSNGAYAAKAGYDNCTGLGSPDGQALLAALKPAPPPVDPPSPGCQPCRIPALNAVAAELWVVVNYFNSLPPDQQRAQYDKVVYAYDQLQAVYQALGTLPV